MHQNNWNRTRARHICVLIIIMVATALAARTAAQNAYDVAQTYTERRHQPLGGGEVNQRQLTTALIKAKAKWAGLDTAQANYTTKVTDVQAKTSEANA